jgi:hypothetical protein
VALIDSSSRTFDAVFVLVKAEKPKTLLKSVEKFLPLEFFFGGSTKNYRIFVGHSKLVKNGKYTKESKDQ